VNTAFIFGATGEIGSSIVAKFKSENYRVCEFSRNPLHGHLFSIDDLQDVASRFKEADCVVWASGANLNDSIDEYDLHRFQSVLDANLIYIVEGLSKLLQAKLLANNCNLVIVSSVWQGFSKQNKFSYTVSKSAVGGLIHSLAADLAPRGMRVNGVLPGVVDTQMTRAALTPDQVKKIERQTPTQALVTLEAVANLVYFLSSTQSDGINGQSVVIDGGWSVVRYV